MRFSILLFEGCEELDVFGPFEALCNAFRAGAGFEVGMGTSLPVSELKMAYGTRVIPEVLKPAAGDWVIVPGGGWLSRSPAGAWAEAERGELPTLLKEWKQSGVLLASVCTGAMLLAKAGLLAGRPATTNHAAMAELRGLGVEVLGAKVVDDGDIVTSGGITSGLELALWLTERYAGSEGAEQLRQALEYPRSAEVHFGPHATVRRRDSHGA